MKNIRNFKGAMLLFTLATTVLILASCTNSQKPKDTKNIAEARNEENFDNNKQEKDAQFLVNASEINLKQIQLGQLAQQKGITAHVKELGKMMEDAHTKSQIDLTALAKRKSIAIPTSPTDDIKDAYKNLNEKSVNDFDKAYGDLMVKRHKDAISTFEKASTDANDTDVKNWAIATLPELRTHLNHSIESQKKSEKM